MGAGILPTTIYKGKLYFLFGKENKYADTPGFSDFGGGTDNKESFLATAIREGGEELTGFLGSDKELKQMLKKYGTYNIDWETYRMHIFPMDYDESLVRYYNNNQKFLQQNLDSAVIKSVKIFEKAEIRWICVDDIMKMRGQFRSYFRNLVDMINAQKVDIERFIRHQNTKTRKTRKNRK